VQGSGRHRARLNIETPGRRELGGGRTIDLDEDLKAGRGYWGKAGVNQGANRGS
jgi:hypothetical protein